MTDEDEARFDRMSARANILIPAIKRMLDETGSTHEEVAATLRVHADLVESKTDPADEAGNRRMAEEIAKAFAAEGAPTKYHNH
jgi:hypothetical protein